MEYTRAKAWSVGIHVSFQEDEEEDEEGGEEVQEVDPRKVIIS